MAIPPQLTPEQRAAALVKAAEARAARADIKARLKMGSTWHVQQTGIIIPESESIMAKFGLPDRIHPKLSWFILWLSPALVFGVTLISSLYPVVRVLRLNPVAAMHDQ